MPLQTFFNLAPLQEREPVPVPATEAAKNALSRKTVSDLKNEEKEETCEESCPICVDNFSNKPDNSVIVEMPCKHKFCEECLNTWLEQNHNCPTCRQEIEGAPRIEPQ